MWLFGIENSYSDGLHEAPGAWNCSHAGTSPLQPELVLSTQYFSETDVNKSVR